MNADHTNNDTYSKALQYWQSGLLFQRQTTHIFYLLVREL